MLLQFIPPPDLFTPLASLGKSLAQIIDPNAAFKQQLQQLLLTNPELGERLAAIQRRLDRERIQATGEAAAVTPEIAPGELEEAGKAAAPTPPAVTREAGRISEAEAAIPPDRSAIGGLEPGEARGFLAGFPPTVQEEAAQRLITTASGETITAREAQIRTLSQTTANQLADANLEPKTRQQTQSAIDQFIEAIPEIAGDDPVVRALLLGAVANGDFVDAMKALLNVRRDLLLASIKAKTQQGMTPPERVSMFAEMTEIMRDFNAEIEELMIRIREADRRERPALVADLQAVFNQRKAVVDELSKIEPAFRAFNEVRVGAEFTAIRNRMQDFVSLEPLVADPALGEKGAILEGIANGDPTVGARGFVERIENGEIPETAGGILAAIRKIPPGEDFIGGVALLDILTPQEERVFIDAIFENLENRRKQADLIDIGGTPEEDLKTELATLKSARTRLKTARAAQGRPGRQAGIRVPKEIERIIDEEGAFNVDTVTGMTRQEVDARIKFVEDALQVFEVRAKRRGRR